MGHHFSPHQPRGVSQRLTLPEEGLNHGKARGAGAGRQSALRMQKVLSNIMVVITVIVMINVDRGVYLGKDIPGALAMPLHP